MGKARSAERPDNTIGEAMITKTINWLEETVIALLLAGMTLVTFAQVIARYIFNTGAVWALELIQPGAHSDSDEGPCPLIDSVPEE